MVYHPMQPGVPITKAQMDRLADEPTGMMVDTDGIVKPQKR